MEHGNMKYSCEKCKLDYATYNGLWKHNKKYHKKILNNPPHINTKITQFTTNIPQNNTNNQSKIIKCSKCTKILSRQDSLKRHEKICKETAQSKNEIIELKEEINKLKTEITKKANKKTINNNNNYGIINNITINTIGNENLSLLNDKEISMIFNKELESITTFIELLNFNERLPENHNHCTTSLESKFLSVYNKDTNTIEKDRKKYFFDKLINTTIDRIQILYNSNKSKFSKVKQKQIENNITNLKTFKDYDFNINY